MRSCRTRSEESHRARVIAANNIVNALFMVVGAGADGGDAGAAVSSIPQVFLVLAVANFGGRDLYLQACCPTSW